MFMQLSWSDQAEIAQALARAYPEKDRLDLSLEELRCLVLSLPEIQHCIFYAILEYVVAEYGDELLAVGEILDTFDNNMGNRRGACMGG